MEPTEQTQAPSGAEWLVGEFAAALARVIEALTGTRPHVDFRRAPEAPAGLTWSKCSFSASPLACWGIGATEETRARLAGEILRAAGIENTDSASAGNTFEEVENQVAGNVAHALSALRKRPISTARQPGAEPAGGSEFFRIELRTDGPDPIPLTLAVSPQAAALAGESTDPGLLQPEPSTEDISSEQNLSTRMDLLLDVQLPVSVSFGQSQLPLRDVIKLTTGSIIELNRTISEPVEVIVNNCIIARGEVVVVEGNFGVRIQQVVSRQERLRSME
ncbi:MAG TPA: flagellar motor switch protein FliN [Bryobacteraceae bacterium]|jgi:flagellar motor switch protein FliN/FliY|nr:flagellar motor switch protein FliN [Bryobacteraceae bacterium]